MPNAESRRPLAIIVMAPDRRDDVYPPHVIARLSEGVRWAHSPITRDELAQDLGVLENVEYLFLGWGAPVLDERLLQHAPALKLVLMAAGTIRPIVSDAFWRSGVPIVSAAAANAIPVADFTVAQIVLSLKNTHRIGREMATAKQGTAQSRTRIPGIYRRSVAVLSMGAIGQLVAKRLAPFGIDVFAYDPFLPAEVAAEVGVTPISLAQAFASCDVVSCHMPLLDETRGIIGAELLQSLKPDAVFVNTARGAVVDEDALIAMLRDRPDVTALLDVTIEEPPRAESQLRSLPNVFLTGHSSGSQGQECWRLGELVCHEFERHRAGLPLLHGVSQGDALTRA